jgi:hypothetical protein
MALTTTGTLSQVLSNYYDKRFLTIAEANYVWKDLGRPGVVPKGEGKTVYWSRYTLPSAKVTALTEGKKRIIALIKSFLNTLENLRIVFVKSVWHCEPYTHAI